MFAKKIINYVFPFRCCVCHCVVSDYEGICADCWPKLDFITKPYCVICCRKFSINLGDDTICGRCLAEKPVLDTIRSLFEFSVTAKNLVHKFKYNDKTSLARLFAKLLDIRFKDNISDIDIIIPIPMHRLKRVFRHYNPPQILARELAKHSGKPVMLDLLFKKRLTKAQVGLNSKQRAKNLAGSFGINKHYNLANKTILLVDDVLTTGATSIECAKLLKKAKAKAVRLVTIAKVVR